jgi:hypothetical protein
MQREEKVMVFIRIILQQKVGARYLYSEGLFDYRHGAYGVHCLLVFGIAPGQEAGHGTQKGSSAAFARNVRIRALRNRPDSKPVHSNRTGSNTLFGEAALTNPASPPARR